MNTVDLNNEIKRLSNLKQHKGKSHSWIEQQAKINLQKKQIDIASRFESDSDKRIGKQLFEDYIRNYDFDNFSDLNTLADLVFEEVLKSNLQDQINKLNTNKQYPSDKLVKSLHEVEERVLHLKRTLGIDKESEAKDDLTKLQQLEKRFSIYVPFHRNEFSTVCASCGTMLLLRRRCGDKDWKNLKHPFFSGRFYYNRRGMELVKKGIWTKEQYAWVFYTSVDYVNWCIEHENDIIEIDGVQQSEIENFIKNNPYLKETTVPSKILKENKIQEK